MGGLGFFPLYLIGIVLSVYVLFIISVIGCILYALLQYVLESAFLYSVMNKNKKNKSLLSWIPFYNKVFLGKIADRNIIGWLIFVFDIIIIVLGIILYVMYKNYVQILLCELVFLMIMIFMVINYVFNLFLSHLIMKKGITSNKIVDIMTLLNIFTLGITRPIILFFIRKK